LRDTDAGAVCARDSMAGCMVILRNSDEFCRS